MSQLKSGRFRKRRRQFLVEGPLSVREALDAHLSPVGAEALQGGGLLYELYATESCIERNPHIVELAHTARVPVNLSSDEVVAALADTEHPQGVVGVCHFLDVPVERVFARGTQLVAVAVRVQDPGNLGTLIRTADAAGADAVVISQESADVYNPKTVRSTVGSLFHVPIVTDSTLPELVQVGREHGLQVFAADAAGEDLHQLGGGGHLIRPTMWLFGNEAHGLSPDEQQVADRRVAVPIYGRAESLNVGAAAAVCLYSSARAFRPSSVAGSRQNEDQT